MTSPRPLDHDWLGACRRAAEGLRAVLREHPTSRERVVETGERGRGRRPDAGHRRRPPRTPSSPSSSGCTRAARASPRSPRSAATVDFGDADVLVVIDPIDGSLNAKRGLTAPRALDRGGRRADDGRRRLRLRLRLRARARSGARRAAGARSSTTCRWTRRRPSAARRDGDSSCRDRVGRPALAARPPTACSRHAAGCAPSARSPSRCARSPPRASTGWRRCGTAGRSTRPPRSSSCARAAGSSPSPALRRPARRPAGPRAALARSSPRARRRRSPSWPRGPDRGAHVDWPSRRALRRLRGRSVGSPGSRAAARRRRSARTAERRPRRARRCGRAAVVDYAQLQPAAPAAACSRPVDRPAWARVNLGNDALDAGAPRGADGAVHGRCGCWRSAGGALMAVRPVARSGDGLPRWARTSWRRN